MSLIDVTPEIEATLKQGPLETGTIIDLFLDNEMLHYSDLFHDLSIDDGTGDGLGLAAYVPMGSRLIPPEKIAETQSLNTQGISLFLDSSRISDDQDVVGALIKKQLIQRRARIRSVLFRPGTNRTEPIWIFNIRDGVVDGLDDSTSVDGVAALEVRIASGSFAYNERRNFSYSPADQADLQPGDTGFSKMAQLIDIKLDWKS